MKSLKLRLFVGGAAVLCAALGLAPLLRDAGRKDPRQIPADPAADSPTGYYDTAAPPPPPALKIDGKENPDVYLQSLDIRVEVTGSIASTRHTMVFKNKSDRVLEGELTFPLPDGRSVTRYALDIDGKMREAVPVEKAKAAEVFEEIEQRRVDPGLLEKVEGNNFRTRVYPIPARGTRTVSIGYEEELTLENSLLYYRLPLAYPDPLEKFSAAAEVRGGGGKPLAPESEDALRFNAAADGNYAASIARENYRPNRALVFALPAPADLPRVMTQSARGSLYFLASVAPALDVRKKRWDNKLAVIWDVSLSGSRRDLARETEALNIIFAEKKSADVYLYFLNNQNTFKGRYKVRNGNWDKLRSALAAAVFDGGTDFSRVNLKKISGKEILFFSDGLSTLSDADFVTNGNRNRPIHCVVSSAAADYGAMKLIAAKTGGKFVNISALSGGGLRRELSNETPLFLGAEHGKSVRETYPSAASPVRGDFSLAGISDSGEAELTLLFGFGGKAEKRIKIRLDAKDDGDRGNVRKIWAQKKIAELDLSYEKNRAELTELGRRFGIATRNTSLIVLESVYDYAHYGIDPPEELSAEYERLRKNRIEAPRDAKHSLLDAAVAASEDIRAWWYTEFAPPKSKPPAPNEDGEDENDDSLRGSMTQSAVNDVPREERVARLVMAPEMKPRSMRLATSEEVTPTLERKREPEAKSGVSGNKGGGDPRARVYQEDADSGVSGPGGFAEGVDAILSGAGGFGSGGGAGRRDGAARASAVKTIRSDNDYLGKLTGKTAKDYQTYLSLREDYANTPAFYFDMANWFYKRGDKETALRVLTSIADLEIENASLYRLLGYRFKEYGEYALERFVCKKVLQWRPMEPQSHRDYALALADCGEAQAAFDSLYGLLTKPFSAYSNDRGRGIEEVVVTEINHLLAKNTKLNVSKINKRVIMIAPVDIRVVINWNMNNTDIDLHVKDPYGEECYYRRRKTSLGGRMSADVWDGYGPEQFLLKNAVKGKYKVYVNYFGDRQVVSAGPSTVMAELYANYADDSEQRRVVCLQLSNAKKRAGMVLVAEFVL